MRSRGRARAGATLAIVLFVVGVLLAGVVISSAVASSPVRWGAGSEYGIRAESGRSSCRGSGPSPRRRSPCGGTPRRSSDRAGRGERSLVQGELKTRVFYDADGHEPEGLIVPSQPRRLAKALETQRGGVLNYRELGRATHHLTSDSSTTERTPNCHSVKMGERPC